MKNSVPEKTIGLDLGDKSSHVVRLNREGEEVERLRIRTREKELVGFFEAHSGSRVALEAGTHSGWVDRLLRELGCEVLVANSRQIPAVTRAVRKSDYRDAETLARLARFDPKLLKPIQHREERRQKDLVKLHAREQLVRSRSRMVCAVRGHCKQFGVRIKRCSPRAFAREVRQSVPPELVEMLNGVLVSIQAISDQIDGYDREIRRLCKQEYPETGVLLQIRGVGELSALAFVLVMQSPERFRTNRKAGPYLGLVPGRCQSGDNDPPQRISKAGNELLRRLLVQCANYLMGHFGIDCDLRRHGEKLKARGGKWAHKRGVVAVARKLAVLMLRLWRTGEVYQPLYNAQKAKAA